MRTCTSPPVWLNCWKHHLGFLCDVLHNAAPVDEKDFGNFCSNLKVMGSSVSDLYTGSLCQNDISSQILQYLKSENVSDQNSYYLWISKQGKGFRETEINDNSTWTLLPGKVPECFIHIHPSRYSPLTRRIKTNILKTAVALIIWSKMPKADEKPNLITANYIRQKYLNLSPLGKDHFSGIFQITNFLKGKC